METFKINIDTGKTCTQCGELGVTERGLCLKCITKAIVNPMQVYLTQDAISVAKACDIKSETPKFKNVHIQNGEIVGCDGYLLARCKVDVKGGNQPLEIKADSLLRSSKPLGKTEITINTEIKKAVIQPSLKEDEGIISVSVELPESATPFDYSKIYPSTERKAYVAFSVDKLKRLISIAGDNGTIRFRIHGSDKPVEYLTGCISGIIMPINIMENIDADSWFKPESV